MTFGQKLKKLRSDNGFTQEQLAEKIFVTRTAISKWETDNGYPSIDSLKAISNLFNVSIDDLISDTDVENKKLLDEKIAKKMYCLAIAFLGVTVLFTLLAYFLKQPYFNIISMVGLIAYLVFGILSKPRYKRIQARKLIVPFVLSRVVIFIVVLGVIVYT
ncbi:MAG: helix-turn-helix domain-containing protein, partial [Clostridia bacterium]|nr:helix-turn-helix domain-containing protein [Clostridia bacterium]